MRESSLISLYERRSVLLNQLSAALRGRTVALWRVARGAWQRPKPSAGGRRQRVPWNSISRECCAGGAGWLYHTVCG